MLVVLAAGLTVSIGFAQEQVPSDDDVNAIARELYCPVCENIPLDVCGTQACAQWRELIREKLGDGWSKEQIKQYFVEQYGDRVLAVPPKRGFNWLAYIVPPLLFAAGVYLLYNGFRSWRQVSASEQPDKPIDETYSVVDDDYIRRMEEELRND